MLFTACSFVLAQQKTPLMVGDAAPELKYSKWLKGTPVKSFEKDRIYVLEYWATWCGPCIQAMPALSEYARKHPEVTVIAYNVMEKVGGRPYDSALPNIEKFVKSMGDKMDFNVAVDDNDQYMHNNWLKRAAINAIPATMIVKDNKLIWIGTPREMESTIASIKNGTYKVTSEGTDEQRAQVAATIQSEEEMLAPYEKAIAAKDYKAAIAALDKLGVENPNLAYPVAMKKFTTYLDFVDEMLAVDVARKFLSGITIGGNTVGNFGTAIADRTGLKPETYLFGVECFQLYIARAQGDPNPLVYDYIAKCYAQAGDYANAAKNQQIVFEKSRDALASGKGDGRITKELLAQYETSLKEYQVKAGKKKN
jgi:thiol-disulfide isomerase/thioredoxin